MVVERSIDRYEKNFHGAMLTIGNFDGLHLGHQALLDTLWKGQGPRVVMTFEPHPLQVLQPAKRLSRLFPREDLIERLPEYGIDLLVILPFTKEFASLKAEAFLTAYVQQPLRPKQVVAGYDFGFGRDREGSLDGLRSWGTKHGVEVQVVEPLNIGGAVVSSRRLREMVLKGDVKGAAELLGRPYYLRGPIVAGAGRGRTIGIPTLNQQVVNETLPHAGVYASRTHSNGQWMNSVTNIGSNPTFEQGSRIKVETHVLDMKVEGVGQMIDVHLIDRLRDEKKFSDVESLLSQIRQDIISARSILKRFP